MRKFIDILKILIDDSKSNSNTTPSKSEKRDLVSPNKTIGASEKMISIPLLEYRDLVKTKYYSNELEKELTELKLKTQIISCECMCGNIQDDSQFWQLIDEKSVKENLEKITFRR